MGAVGFDKFCLKSVKLSIIEYYLETNDQQTLFEHFENETDFMVRSNLLGYLVRNGDYDQAEGYITSTENFDFTLTNNEDFTLTEEEIDFLEVQKINIKIQKEYPVYEPTSQEANKILEVALKQRPLDVYARNLWYLLYEEHLPIKIPELKEKAEERNEDIAPELNDIIGYPNPVQIG